MPSKKTHWFCCIAPFHIFIYLSFCPRVSKKVSIVISCLTVLIQSGFVPNCDYSKWIRVQPWFFWTGFVSRPPPFRKSFIHASAGCMGSLCRSWTAPSFMPKVVANPSLPLSLYFQNLQILNFHQSGVFATGGFLRRRLYSLLFRSSLVSRSVTLHIRTIWKFCTIC